MKNLVDDPRIEAALDSYPLESLPVGFVERTMARVQRPRRWGLQFLDIALPAFLALFLALVAGLALWGMTRIDPLWLARMRLSFELLRLNTPPQVLWLGLAIVSLVVSTLLSAAVILYIVTNRPRSLARLRT